MKVNKNQARHPAGAVGVNGEPIGGEYKKSKPDELPLPAYSVPSWDKLETLKDRISEPTLEEQQRSTEACKQRWHMFLNAAPWRVWLKGSVEARQAWHHVVMRHHNHEAIQGFKERHNAQQQFGLSSEQMSIHVREQFAETYGRHLERADKLGLLLLELQSTHDREAVPVGVNDNEFRYQMSALPKEKLPAFIMENDVAIAAAWVMCVEKPKTKNAMLREAVSGWAYALAEELQDEYEQAVEKLCDQLKSAAPHVRESMVADTAFVGLSSAYNKAAQLEAHVDTDIEAVVKVLQQHFSLVDT